jgi:uncharacterized protein YcbK (DUF882 family)
MPIVSRFCWAFAGLAAATVAAPAAVDAPVPRSLGIVLPPPGRSADSADDDGDSDSATVHRLLGTLVQTHTDERVVLDEDSPSAERFSALLADPATGERVTFDPRLLELIRALGRRHPGARFELVSGYRSAKLNEMMRKKGHHVASHSQHSLGHAVDLRLFEAGADHGLDPRALEREIRELAWDGGVGVYLLPSDRFVHVDVGRLRRWDG